ncbi:MAG: diguanylate cyclase [Gammaproteobacteria bacterium SG8_47]|nr:MAG: diguanylate cyclase [Gammaproteobacteria bacterium SG8_47]
MSRPELELTDLYWLMDMLQSIDVGLLVIDRDYQVQIWNSFMENHSGVRPDRVIGKNLFDSFGDIPREWFKRKADSVFMLKSRAFTTWEQRPYLFRFKNYRPITGTAEFMYQNITFIPLISTDGVANHVGVIIYDVTDTAVGKMELEAANQQLQALSRTDRLTELNNRGYWEECMQREYMRVKRTQQPCSLIMFDIDHFKKVNDTYGHQAGDEVIRQTAATLRETIRATDIPGRYGGEEFGVILIDTKAEDAMILAERLRQKIEAQSVSHDGQTISYTISLGISEVNGTMADYKQWLECSDQALYQSKHGGRNRATIFAAK